MMLIFIWYAYKFKLEWGCPNGTQYPPPPAATNTNSPSYARETILPNRARLQTDGQTDGRGDSSIPPPPLTSLRGV